MGELIRLFGRAEVPAVMSLKEAAGWNQTVEDWELLLDLSPEGCFCLECDGEIAASATIMRYGVELAWVGMVLTGPRFRGRGFARRLMNRTIEFARAHHIRRVGLDATDMGIALYRSLGFRDTAALERWEAMAPSPPEPAELLPYLPDPKLDLRAFGADRTHVLGRLARAESASTAGGGFVMGRPGAKAHYFGPCVASSTDLAEELLCWFLARHAGERIYWDLLPENRAAAALAGRYGFRPVRRLTRMMLHLDDVEPLQAETAAVFGIAGFELG